MINYAVTTIDAGANNLSNILIRDDCVFACNGGTTTGVIDSI